VAGGGGDARVVREQGQALAGDGREGDARVGQPGQKEKWAGSRITLTFLFYLIKTNSKRLELI
jgi:hypothetical protein